MKANETFKKFQSEAEGIFADGKLKVVEPNTGNELTFDENEGKFLITEPYGKVIKKYVSFEKAIDYLLENC